MTLCDLCKQLPREYRQQLLDGNVIYKAIAKQEDTHMAMLFIYWKNYFEPGNESLEMACRSCLNSILEKFKMLEQYFVELEKEDQLLEL